VVGDGARLGRHWDLCALEEPELIAIIQYK
jgi:hypothetical protein